MANANNKDKAMTKYEKEFSKLDGRIKKIYDTSVMNKKSEFQRCQLRAVGYVKVDTAVVETSQRQK